MTGRGTVRTIALVRLIVLTLALSACSIPDAWAERPGARPAPRTVDSSNEPQAFDEPRWRRLLAGRKTLREPISPARRLSAAESVNTFGIDLYRKLGRANENLVFSPFSAFAALGMTYAGARGKTKAEMAKALAIKPNMPIHGAFRSLSQELHRSVLAGNGELVVANAMWADKVFKLSTSFTDTLWNNYDAEVRSVDFRNKPRKAAEEINQWVSEKTHGKIPSLVPTDQVALQQWVLALVNAVYLKAAWRTPFSKGATSHEPFTLSDGSKISVPMMSGESTTYSYLEEPGFQAVELLYGGRDRSMVYSPPDLSMVVFLPKRIDGLERFEDSLTAENLSEWLDKFRQKPAVAKVFLPKFESRTRSELIPMLQAMGMKSAFHPRLANFREMLDERTGRALLGNLFITAVLQEAWIKTDEEGTEAAAATAVGIAVSAAPPELPKEYLFRADHPFFIIIYHRPTKCILFMGRVTDPRGVGFGPGTPPGKLERLRQIILGW